MVHLIHLPLRAAELVLERPDAALALLLSGQEFLVGAAEPLFILHQCLYLEDELLLLFDEGVQLDLDFVVLSLKLIFSLVGVLHLSLFLEHGELER